MPNQRIPAVFMRGGTSKGLIFKASDLPGAVAERDRIFLAAMGSPDAFGRQLDGMGGGISSLSKVCIVGPATVPGADVDYTFAQIPVDGTLVDYGGNCGNMSAAIGPFAVEEGLVATPDGEVAVRIHNTNTGKIIVSRFAVQGGAAVIDGTAEIDGVSGGSAPILLDFQNPGGAKTGRLLPTGRGTDELAGAIPVSLVDAANPCAFVEAATLGKDAGESPDELERDPAFMRAMENIRRAASVAMGITRDLDEAAALASVPKVAIVGRPARVVTLSGREMGSGDYDISVRMLSMGRVHRAVPITGAICLGVAMRVPGTLPHRLAGAPDRILRIAHPSGRIEVDARVGLDAGGLAQAEAGTVLRTARRLFDGHVHYRGG